MSPKGDSPRVMILMARLQGRIALITGGAAGIGLAAGQRFAREGATVLLVDHQADALTEAVRASLPGGSGQLHAFPADVTDPQQVEAALQAAEDRFGGLDILVANAGIEGQPAPIADHAIEAFDRVLAVNLRGVWLSIKYAVPRMCKRGGGSIILTSSIAGERGFAGFSAYVASKHAVVGIMRSAALELAPENIRVNTVNPGFIATRMMDTIHTLVAPGAESQAQQQFTARVPMGRYGTPEEVAELMLFLASEESRYCTGGTYFVDGGFAAG